MARRKAFRKAVRCPLLLGEGAINYLKAVGEREKQRPRVWVRNVRRTPAAARLFAFTLKWWPTKKRPKGCVCFAVDGVEAFVAKGAATLLRGNVLDYEVRQDGSGFFFRQAFNGLDSYPGNQGARR